MSDDTEQLRSELAKARADLDAAILSVAGGWMRTGNEHEIERAISVHVAAAVAVATADMRADLARIRAAVEPLDLYFRSKHELGAVVQMSVDPRETFAMRNVLAEVGTAVGLVAAPTDAQIVDLMKQRGNGTREQPRTEMGIPVGLAWRNEAIMEADAQAAWDRHHASEATP